MEDPLSRRPGASRRSATFPVVLLSIIGLVVVYGSVVLAEAVGMAGLASFLRNDAGLPPTLIRVVVLSVTALPISYLTGCALVRWAPVQSGRVMTAVALLHTTVITLLQVVVYHPSVLGATILKVVFVVGPLALAASRSRRTYPP